MSDGAGYEDIAPIYRQLVDGGADWVILWASGYNTVGPQLAEETGTKTVVIGAFENGLVPGLSTDFETDAQDGAYLAGMVAALMSQIGHHRHRGLRRRRELEQDGRRVHRGGPGGAARHRHQARPVGSGRLRRRPGGQAGDRQRHRRGSRHHLRHGRRFHLRHDPGCGERRRHRPGPTRCGSST